MSAVSLDFNPTMNIVPIVRLIEGRHLEASWWWSRMRRPRACLAARTRAAPGLRLVANTGCPPGAWLTEAAHVWGGHESAARRRKEDARK